MVTSNSNRISAADAAGTRHAGSTLQALRSQDQCALPATGQQRGYHNTYHFDDVAVERDHFDRSFQGKNPHDLVGAMTAAIAVVWDMPPSGPIRADKKEAVFLLAQVLGDLHQPCMSRPSISTGTASASIPMRRCGFDPASEICGNLIRDHRHVFQSE